MNSKNTCDKEIRDLVQKMDEDDDERYYAMEDYEAHAFNEAFWGA